MASFRTGEQILIEIKLLAMCTDDFFLSMQSMHDRNTIGKICDWFIYNFPSSPFCRFFASHIRNQSKFRNLFRVNLHHVARLTPGERFLWIMTRFFCSRSCDLYRIGFRNCRHLQTTRRARTTSGEENVIIYLNYVKMFELLSDKSEFHGQFSRPD